MIWRHERFKSLQKFFRTPSHEFLTQRQGQADSLRVVGMQEAPVILKSITIFIFRKHTGFPIA